MIVRKAIFLLASVFASAALLAAGRSDYLDLMEAAVDAYTPERRAAYVERVERDGITEHGFARLVSNIGILVANGRKDGLRGEFVFNAHTHLLSHQYVVRVFAPFRHRQDDMHPPYLRTHKTR